MEVGQKVYLVKDIWKGPTLMETEVEKVGKKELRLKYHTYFNKTRYSIDTKFHMSPEEAWAAFRDEMLIKLEYAHKCFDLANGELKKLGGIDIMEKKSEEKEGSQGSNRVL